MTGQNAYRYPGSRPFEDTDIDRKLFFGREREKDEFLHRVLVKNLVVLYAKSGLGKTSLINAGVSRLLRKNACLPLRVRFNDAGTDPVRTVYDSINNAAQVLGLDYDPGEEKTLWQYFKTAAFWSAEDSLMTPVIILDQFEEFFAFHESGAREMFIEQLAHLVNGTIPSELRRGIDEGQPFPYGETPPNVKIVISIREDFLGQLDELCTVIPDILRSRYRLLPLTRKQAREAITKPSQVQDEHIRSAGFRYSDGAMNTMLDYLSKGKEKGGVVIRDEVESFQLQVLCQHIESNIMKKRAKDTGAAQVIVKKEDLGGESGMHKVLQNFYENQLAGLKTTLRKRRVRRLCEKGLISTSDRRLSREEEEIEGKFNISPSTLEQLVDSRLLRAEKRVGSVYYELSHDTLVTPVRLSQRKRRATRNKYALFILLPIFLAMSFTILSRLGESARRKEINNLYAQAQSFALDGKYDDSIEIYNKALALNPKSPYTYNYLGMTFHKKDDYDTAIVNYKKALAFDPEFEIAYMNMGNVYAKTGRYDEAIECYGKAIGLVPEFGLAYMNLGNAYCEAGRFDEAIESHRKAIQLDPGLPQAYYNIGLVFQLKGDNDEAIESYLQALKIKPDYPDLKQILTELYFVNENIDKALKMADDVLKIENIPISHAMAMRYISISALLLQGRRPGAVTALNKLITDCREIIREITSEYEQDWDYGLIKSFITRTKRLNEQDRHILLKLIDLLESPKSFGEPKLKELVIY